MMKSSTLFECGTSPPTSTSRPPDAIHVISVPTPSPFFNRVFYTEHKQKNPKLEGGYAQMTPNLRQPQKSMTH